MKNDRCGQAEVLTDEQLSNLLDELEPKYKLLFGICYYTSSRVSEALKLVRTDFIKDKIVFRSSTTKTKDSREVKIGAKLLAIINEVGLPEKGYIFPSGNKHITRQSADKVLRKACDLIGLEGVSTHSFRRTGITKMYRSGADIKSIQGHTGHKNLNSLLKYVDTDRATVDALVDLL